MKTPKTKIPKEILELYKESIKRCLKEVKNQVNQILKKKRSTTRIK